VVSAPSAPKSVCWSSTSHHRRLGMPSNSIGPGTKASGSLRWGGRFGSEPGARSTRPSPVRQNQAGVLETVSEDQHCDSAHGDRHTRVRRLATLVRRPSHHTAIGHGIPRFICSCCLRRAIGSADEGAGRTEPGKVCSGGHGDAGTTGHGTPRRRPQTRLALAATLHTTAARRRRPSLEIALRLAGARPAL
jgi:hypothetical protein